MESKKLAIIIRAHGGIRTNIDPRIVINENQLIDNVDLEKYSDIRPDFEVVTVSLAKLGGVCYGDSRIQPFISSINTHYRNRNNSRIKLEDKINEIFGENPPEEIKNELDRIVDISFPPVINSNANDLYFNKHYTMYDANSGVYILASENINAIQLTMIRATLANLNRSIQHNEILTKKQIIESISPLIHKLYFIDFTCGSYENSTNMPKLTSEYVDWMNGVFAHHHVAGDANNKRRKNKTRNKRSKLNKTKRSRRR